MISESTTLDTIKNNHETIINEFEEEDLIQAKSKM